MNKIAIALLLILAGCTKRKSTKEVNSEIYEPKFTYLQEVSVSKGFLKGQTVIVLSNERCKADNQGTYSTDVVCYTIKIKDNPPDGRSSIWSNVPERELEF